jgi:hypothetical protein
MRSHLVAIDHPLRAWPIGGKYSGIDVSERALKRGLEISIRMFPIEPILNA